MKLLNKILSVCALCFALNLYTEISNAAVVSGANVAAGITNVWNGGALMTTCRIDNTNTTVATVYLYASPTNLITFTNAAYVTFQSVNTNITNIYTDPLGRSQTNVFAAIQLVQTTNAANTNLYPLIAVVTVPPTNSSTLVSSQGFRFGNGITLTNDKTVDFTIQFTPY